ncbi:MAG: hypothetical protein K0R67_1500, partial [Paenibacillus sp.]|jgi:hypothetical protein|nr:hypothetical protein [Paenibacillus sp.]
MQAEIHQSDSQNPHHTAIEQYSWEGGLIQFNESQGGYSVVKK